MQAKVKSVNPFWKRDGFKTELHYKAAKKGPILRMILRSRESMRGHPDYITALVAERAGLVKE